MIKKNGKILLAYVLGIILSMFLQVPLSPFFSSSPVVFSVITGVITVSLVYTEMWRFGKYDAIRKENSVLKAIGYMGFYITITFAVELIVIIFKTYANITVPEIIHTIWFFPFIGFYTNRTLLVVSLAVTLIIIAMAVVAYYMGVAGVSISDKILNARKKRIDEKAEKHFEEIERIKEEYRNR